MAVALAAGCNNFSLPPPVGPGSIAGRVVVPVSGRLEAAPAVGVEVFILGTNVSAVTNEDGRFVVSPVLSSDGTLLLRLDIDGDGAYERQRSLSLSTLGARPGLDLNLGELALYENGRIEGQVRRAEAAGIPVGHGGVAVFVPGIPYSTLTADDGRFVLDGVPPGEVHISFYLPGYRSRTVGPQVVDPGETLLVSPVVLEADPTPPTSVSVRGRVFFEPATDDATAATVTATRLGGEVLVSVGSDGVFEQAIDPGLYDLTYRHPDYGVARVSSVLVLPPEDGSTVMELPDLTLTEGQEERVVEGAPIPADVAAPVAAVAHATTGRTGEQFFLDASPSSQADTHPLVFQWRQTSGEAVTLSENDTVAAMRTSFVAPSTPGSVGLELTVLDAVSGKADALTTTITFVDAPAVTLRVPALVQTGQTVSLDASATTGPAGHTLVFHWDQSAGETVTLSDNDTSAAAIVTFTAPATAQTLAFALTVTDQDNGATSTGFASLTVAEGPTARIAGVGIVATGEAVTLDGSASTAPNNGSLVYHWNQTGGDTVTLSANDSPFAATTAFTAPSVAGLLTFELRVEDVATGYTHVATVSVTVGERPTAIISPNVVSVVSVTPVRFTAGGSLSPTGAPLNYAWEVGGADVTVDSPTLDGEYLDVTAGLEAFVVRLTVTDPYFTSAPTEVGVTISAQATYDPVLTLKDTELTVDVGATVVMEAYADHPYATETFTFAWTQLLGDPVALVITAVDAKTSRATFVAPPDEQDLAFDVTLTGSSGGKVFDGVRVHCLDVTPPQVVSTDPDATTVSPSVNIVEVTFDEPILRASLDSTTVWITDDATGQAVPGGLDLSNDGLRVTFVPHRPLTAGSAYTLHVGALSDRALTPNVRTTIDTVGFTPVAPVWTRWTGPNSGGYLGVAVDDTNAIVWCGATAYKAHPTGVLQSLGTYTALGCCPNTNGPRGRTRNGIYAFYDASGSYNIGAKVVNQNLTPTSGSVYTLSPLGKNDHVFSAGCHYAFVTRDLDFNFDDTYERISTGTWDGRGFVAMTDGGIFYATGWSSSVGGVPVFRRDLNGVWSRFPTAGALVPQHQLQPVRLYADGESVVVIGNRDDGGPDREVTQWREDLQDWVRLADVPSNLDNSVSTFGARGRTLFVLHRNTVDAGLRLYSLDMSDPTASWVIIPGPDGDQLVTGPGCTVAHAELQVRSRDLHLAYDKSCAGVTTLELLRLR